MFLCPPLPSFPFYCKHQTLMTKSLVACSLSEVIKSCSCPVLMSRFQSYFSLYLSTINGWEWRLLAIYTNREGTPYLHYFQSLFIRQSFCQLTNTAAMPEMLDYVIRPSLDFAHLLGLSYLIRKTKTLLSRMILRYKM